MENLDGYFTDGENRIKEDRGAKQLTAEHILQQLEWWADKNSYNKIEDWKVLFNRSLHRWIAKKRKELKNEKSK